MYAVALLGTEKIFFAAILHCLWVLKSLLMLVLDDPHAFMAGGMIMMLFQMKNLTFLVVNYLFKFT